MKATLHLFFYSILLVVTACSAGRSAMQGGSSRSMTPREYCTWVQSEAYPYRDTQVINNVLFILEYQPQELEIARLLQGNRITEQEARDGLAEKTENLHFLLTIITPEAGKDLYHFRLKTQESPADRAAYYSFDFKKDIRLIGSDSIAPSAYLPERGIANYPVTKFNLDFTGRSLKELHAFTIYDKYFQQGWITFPLTGWKTRQLPHLQLSRS
jgi:hypothetical protein